MPEPPTASVAAALGAVPLLAALPAEVRTELAAELRTVRVAAGDWLFRQGDVARSAFVVHHGRLEVVKGTPPIVISVLGRGAILGELALLGEGTRLASVRARRDSELIEVPRARFEMLLSTVPAFAIGLTRAIGERLAATRTPAPPPRPPRSLAVVALDARAPAAEISQRLAAALRGHGSLAHLRAGDAVHPDDRVGRLDRAEREHDRVLLDAAGAAQGDGWAEFCRSEADLVIAVCGGVPDESWFARPTALHGCELLAVGTPVAARAIEQFAPREVQAIGAVAQLPAAVEALARRLSGRAVGLVLSGGGARAFAHLGVYDELLAAGVRIDRVGGTSMGGLFAAFIAYGTGPDEIHAIFQRDFVERNPTNDYTLPVFSLIRGRKTRGMLADRFGDVRIEQLARRFYCVSCDLVAREVVLHRTGLLRAAVYAGLAIPGVFPPVRDGHQRLLVDGGVLDNLPVEPMARAGEGPVIAVDVGQRPDPQATDRAARRLGALGRRLTGSDTPLPRVGETLMRTLTIGSADSVAAALRHADLVIAPRVEGVRMLDWKQLDHVREIGRRAAREALAAYEGDLQALR